MPVTTKVRRNWLRVLAGVIVTWAFFAGMILLEILPFTPRSFRGWALPILEFRSASGFLTSL